MRNEFIDFLRSHDLVHADDTEQIQTLLNQTQEPIGSIAFCFGMLCSSALDTILDEQGKTHSRFGEVAVKLGILTSDQVDAIIRVQQVRATTEVAEALALTGLCPIDQTMKHLGRFLTEHAGKPSHQPVR